MQRLLLLICCCAVAAAQASSTSTPSLPTIVHTQAQWDAAVASGRPTPLDALTPYGKRRFLRMVRWSGRGLGGFGTTPLVRELDAAQLAAVLAFLDSADYVNMLSKQLDGAPLRLPAPDPAVEQALDGFEAIAAAAAAAAGKQADAQAVTPRRSDALLRAYLAAFGQRMDAAALHREALGNLAPLFDAAVRADTAYPGAAPLEHMRLVRRELVARGIDTRRSIDPALLQALIAARAFDEARAFALAHPALARYRVPAVRDPLGPRFQGRSVLRYDQAAGTLTRAPAPAPDGIQLVMVVDAGCHFSRNALEAIRTDAALRARLQRAHLMLVTPPATPIAFDFIADWNAANPALPINAPFDLREWRDIDVDGVPAFFVFRQGRVVARLDGWPGDGAQAALLALLDRQDGAAAPAPERAP